MPSNFDLTGVYQEELGEALDRIRTLEAQRDELLAALEAVKPHVNVMSADGTLALIQVIKAIAQAKGTTA